MRQPTLSFHTSAFASTLQLIDAIGTLGFGTVRTFLACSTETLAIDTYAVITALWTLLYAAILTSESVQALASASQAIAGTVLALLWTAFVHTGHTCPPLVAVAGAIQTLPALVAVRFACLHRTGGPCLAGGAGAQAAIDVACASVGAVVGTGHRGAVDTASAMLTLAGTLVADATAIAVVGTHFSLAIVTSEASVALADASWLTCALTRAVLHTLGCATVSSHPVVVTLACSVVAVSVPIAVLGALLLSAVKSPVTLVAQTHWVGWVRLVA